MYYSTYQYIAKMLNTIHAQAKYIPHASIKVSAYIEPIQVLARGFQYLYQ